MIFAVVVQTTTDFPAQYEFSEWSGGVYWTRICLWWIPVVLLVNICANMAGGARNRYWALIADPDSPEDSDE